LSVKERLLIAAINATNKNFMLQESVTIISNPGKLTVFISPER
jgi:hypothetical protein